MTSQQLIHLLPVNCDELQAYGTVDTLLNWCFLTRACSEHPAAAAAAAEAVTAQETVFAAVAASILLVISV